MKLLRSIREILQSAGDILRLLWQAHPRAFTGCKPTNTTAPILPTLSLWANFPNFSAVMHLIVLPYSYQQPTFDPKSFSRIL
ncbi:MAG: hypothetical protein R6X32_19560 [Chloroflexota bacterium]